MEAATASVALIVCITEGIPTLDMVRAMALISRSKSRLIGPTAPESSLRKCKIESCRADIQRGRVG